MEKRTVLVLAVAASFIFLSAGLGLCQEAEVEQGGAVPEVQAEEDAQWVWGEVVSVDAAANTVVVKYLDYETDQEKDISVSVDAKTTYENASALSDIKVKDTLSIDYVTVNGKNIAKNISVEKPDMETTAPAASDMPAIGGTSVIWILAIRTARLSVLNGGRPASNS